LTRPRRSWAQRALLTVNVVLIVACLALAALFRGSYTRVEAISRYQLSGALTPVEQSEGGRILNVLLVGYDSADGLDPDDPIQTGREGERNGDVVIVAHLDERSGSAALLSFPRDLWVPIAGTSSEQKINAAYAVGGAETLIRTIEERFAIPIHHYVEVDFAGFQGLVDAVGSVPVWFDAPARDWNERDGITQTGFEMLETGCQELGPVQSLAYVRSRFYQTMDDEGRWITDPRSDLGRIERQQDFLRRLLVRGIDRGARNPFVLRQLIDVGLERVTIDQALTPQELFDLGQRFRSFDPAELATYTVPVEFGRVGSASVLFVQDEPLEPILQLFRGFPPDDPTTIRVAIDHDGVDAEQLDTVRDLLREEDYEVFAVAASDVAPGIAVRHPPGAYEAAWRLGQTVWPGAAVVLDESLTDRDVLLTLGGRTPPVAPGPRPGDEPPSAEPPPPPPTALDPVAACR
jgi:polyisoprenyl-teichoic acid--peptidoglycan teichoic acid transferase